jgi:hypothetical protein
LLAVGIVISRYGKVAEACQAITPRRKAALQRENIGNVLAGNDSPIVHTARAFDPTAQQAAQHRETA